MAGSDESFRAEPKTGAEQSPDSTGVKDRPGGGFTRRALLKGGGAMVGAAAVGGFLAGGAAGRETAPSGAPDTAATAIPFWGAHQAGIVTGTQRNVVLAAFDITAGSDRSDLIALLKAWTALGAEIAAGKSVTIPIYAPSGSANTNAYADATGGSTTDDSLEAYLLGPQRLTLTVGFGRSLFVGDGSSSATNKDSDEDRFGIRDKLPTALIDLPHFAGDEFVAAESDGDLFLQACADDPQVAFHAVRSIARIAPDIATLRYTQIGFSPSNTGGTPRNLMGFKDGTMNSNGHPPHDLNTTVWAGSESPTWMAGGSYLVYRRIRITLEHWDRIDPGSQEQVIGRRKLDGAPLGEKSEFSALDLKATNSSGEPLIPTTSHVAAAAPQNNDGAIILRRAFSYNNGTTQFVERWPPWRQALEYDAGLLFLGYQSDPRKAFVPIFTRMSAIDALNQFTTHTASGVFAIPPAASGPGDWIGRTLLS